VALHLLAPWLCRGPAGIRGVEKAAARTPDVTCADAGGGRRKRGRRVRPGVRPHLACHRGSSASAAHHRGRDPHQRVRGLSDRVHDPVVRGRARCSING
jgi:hypothetical protein